MGLRFRRRLRIVPGLSLNLSKSGPSVSVGVRGAHVTYGARGRRTTVGLPGTGLSYTDYQRCGPSQAQPPQVQRRSLAPIVEIALIAGLMLLALIAAQSGG